jgi:hypothetical protein
MRKSAQEEKISLELMRKHKKREPKSMKKSRKTERKE